MSRTALVGGDDVVVVAPDDQCGRFGGDVEPIGSADPLAGDIDG
ncbi:MAG: hypothetical protein ACLPVY_12785 [Acidimicrobiia bacterium]